MGDKEERLRVHAAWLRRSRDKEREAHNQLKRTLDHERAHHRKLCKAVRDLLDVSDYEDDTAELRELRLWLWDDTDTEAKTKSEDR